MKYLFTLILAIAPLLVLSQRTQSDIERLNQSSWKISNDAAQAHYYISVERDSLRSENQKLRNAIDSLKQRNSYLIEKVIAYADTQSEILSDQSDRLDEQQEASEELREANDFITKYWKNLARDSHLSGVLSVDVNNANSSLGFSPFLSIPLTGKFSLVVIPSYSPSKKPIYRAGIKYSLF